MFSNLFVQLIMPWMNWVHNSTNWANSYDLCIARLASSPSWNTDAHLPRNTDTNTCGRQPQHPSVNQTWYPSGRTSPSSQFSFQGNSNSPLSPKSKSNPITGVGHCTQHRASTNHIVTYWAVISSPKRYSPVSLCFQSHSRKAPASTWRNISREDRLSITSNATVVVVRKTQALPCIHVVSCPVASLRRSDSGRVQPSHHCWFWTYPALLHAQKAFVALATLFLKCSLHRGFSFRITPRYRTWLERVSFCQNNLDI